MLDSNTGMIVNLGAFHYISIRKHNGVYYLMDSENQKRNIGSEGFISKLLDKDTNVTFTVGPYDINTSKKAVIHMKIQEYLSNVVKEEGEADEKYQDNEELEAQVLNLLHKFITNSDDSDSEWIEMLYDEEIQKMPYELMLEKINNHSMRELAELLTTPEK